MLETTLITVKEWWHVITGIFLGLWFGVRKLFSMILSRHPTHEQMEDCKQDISKSLRALLMEHEQDEFGRIDKIEAINQEQHQAIEHKLERLDDKLSDTTSEIIAILRSK